MTLFKFSFRWITLIHGIWSIPFVLIMRIIRPFILIRVGTIRSDRIGHFAADAGHQWIILNSRVDKTLDLYWLDRATCNKQWEKMVRRNFPVYHWAKYLDIWNKFIPGGYAHYRLSSTTHSRDIHGLLHMSNIKMMEFLPDEEKKAKSWMRSKGWSDAEPFVCLLVRDSAYLTQDNLHANTFDYTYHNYRNSDISTYIEAMEWLADSGVWVFRMGKIMNVPISSKHPKIIDYAFSSNKSDLLDIWLFANCDLCISNGSGPDMVSDVYRRPLLFLNYLPIIYLFSWSNAMHLPKHLINSKSGDALTLMGHLENSYLHSEEYTNANIKIVNLSSLEVLSAVKECWARVIGTWVDTKNDIEEQKKFWSILINHKNSSGCHGYIHEDAKISSIFLRNNANFLQ